MKANRLIWINPKVVWGAVIFVAVDLAVFAVYNILGHLGSHGHLIH